jgi:hypothetical protein
MKPAELVTTSEAAELAGASRTLVYAIAMRGRILPAGVVRIGRRIYLRRSVVLQWIARRQDVANRRAAALQLLQDQPHLSNGEIARRSHFDYASVWHMRQRLREERGSL